jgi:hypothetical protein
MTLCSKAFARLRLLRSAGPRNRALALFAALTLLEQVTACTDEETGREILDRARRMEETSRFWADRSQKVHMEIHDANGRQRVRDLTSYEKRASGDRRKSILFLTAPSEYEGIGLLQVTRRDGPSDQTIHRPVFNDVHKLPTRLRGEPFVGSDLSFRDLDLLQALPTWTAEEAEARLLGESTIDGKPCHEIELSPRREDVGYGRIVLWLAKDDLTPRRLLLQGAGAIAGSREGPKNDADKQIELRQVERVGSIPIPHHIEVERLGAGSKTVLEISDVKFDQGFEEDLFSEEALERGRR